MASSSVLKKQFEDAVVSAPAIDHATAKADDVELWAIRVPPGFDVSKLDQLQLGAAGASGDGFALRETPAGESASSITAFPSAKKGKWIPGKGFARQFSVVMAPPEPHASSSMAPPPGLPPVEQKRGFRLNRPFPDIAPEPPPPVRAAVPKNAAASRKRPAEDTPPPSKSESTKKAAKKRK